MKGMYDPFDCKNNHGRFNFHSVRGVPSILESLAKDLDIELTFNRWGKLEQGYSLEQVLRHRRTKSTDADYGYNIHDYELPKIIRIMYIKWLSLHYSRLKYDNFYVDCNSYCLCFPDSGSVLYLEDLIGIGEIFLEIIGEYKVVKDSNNSIYNLRASLSEEDSSRCDEIICEDGTRIYLNRKYRNDAGKSRSLYTFQDTIFGNYSMFCDIRSDHRTSSNVLKILIPPKEVKYIIDEVGLEDERARLERKKVEDKEKLIRNERLQFQVKILFWIGVSASLLYAWSSIS